MTQALWQYEDSSVEPPTLKPELYAVDSFGYNFVHYAAYAGNDKGLYNVATELLTHGH